MDKYGRFWPPSPRKKGPPRGAGPLDCQKSPSRTTCAYGWDTDREIWRRECARLQSRVRGSAANFVPRGQTQRPRPADETGSCVWRSAPIFTRALCGPPGKLAKRKRKAAGRGGYRCGRVAAQPKRCLRQMQRGGAGAAVCFLQAGHVPRRKSRAPQPGLGKNNPPDRAAKSPPPHPP